MNSLRNSVRLIGNLGGNPEIKELAQGKKLAKFSLATTENYKDADGNKVSETQWHNIIAWGRQADFAEKYLEKGNQIAIEGKLLTRTYVDCLHIQRKQLQCLYQSEFSVCLRF